MEKRLKIILLFSLLKITFFTKSYLTESLNIIKIIFFNINIFIDFFGNVIR